MRIRDTGGHAESEGSGAPQGNRWGEAGQEMLAILMCAVNVLEKIIVRSVLGSCPAVRCRNDEQAGIPSIFLTIMAGGT
jgi:hypothetical protein